MEAYTTFDIEKKLGIPRNRLQQWLDRGVIRPEIEQASGIGTKNLFSRNDLYSLELFQLLIWCGLYRFEAAEELSDVRFERVSESDIMYLTLRREPFGNPAVGLAGSSNLTHDPPTIDSDGEVLVTVINLLLIKKRVDDKLA